jgi:hypothetical protein
MIPQPFGGIAMILIKVIRDKDGKINSAHEVMGNKQLRQFYPYQEKSMSTFRDKLLKIIATGEYKK